MATHSLLLLARTYLANPSGVRQKCPHPVIIWEPPKAVVRAIDTTDVSGTPLAFERGEPVAIELVKGVVPNAFPFGVTIGHAENNDVVLRHQQVSRFHAYVQEANRRRYLVDANSRNGTSVNGQRLTPSKAFELPPKAIIRLGLLEVTYLVPEELLPWLEGKLQTTDLGPS
jgi:pSer/pThr/pTyr-binding forkhead associated (FHA) protein